MILLIHGALGAACGRALRRPAPTLAAAIASHFLVDAIAHEEPFDEGAGPRLGPLTLDAVLFGLALSLVARRHGPFSAESIGTLAAALPDAEHLLGMQKRSLRSPLHDVLPHAVWPARGIGLGRQFLIGAAAWLALFGLGARRPPMEPAAGDAAAVAPVLKQHPEAVPAGQRPTAR